MIQQPRTVFAAPLIDIDFAKSGNDWIYELLLSNHQNDLKKFGNLFCSAKASDEQIYFQGRLLFASMVQTENVENVLNEKMNIGDKNITLFRLKDIEKKRPSKLNLGLAIFQHDTDDNNPFKNEYTILALTQDAENIANYNIGMVNNITAKDATFFRSLNNNHTDIIKLANALISTTKMFADESMVVDLLTKKLVDDLQGVMSETFPTLLKIRKGMAEPMPSWTQVSSFILLFGSQIEVVFELDDYNPVLHEIPTYKNVRVVVYDKELDGSLLTETLDLDAISKRIDIDKLYDIVMTEYKRQYNLTV